MVRHPVEARTRRFDSASEHQVAGKHGFESHLLPSGGSRLVVQDTWRKAFMWAIDQW